MQTKQWSDGQWYDSYITYNNVDSAWTKVSTYDIYSPSWNYAAMKGVAYNMDCLSWYSFAVNWGQFAYFPYRVMNGVITWSDSGNNHAYVSTTKYGTLNFWLKWWSQTDGASLISYWNQSRQARLNLLSAAITSLSQNARTYADNFALYTTASTGTVNYTTQIQQCTTQLANINTSIDTYNSAVNTAQTAKATATSTYTNLASQQAAVSTQINTQNSLNAADQTTITGLSGNSSTLAATAASYTSLATAQKAAFAAAIATLLLLIPSQATNINSASSALDGTTAGQTSCTNLLQVLPPTSS